MRRPIAFVCSFLILSGSLPVALAADPPFPDMATSWFRYSESVTYLRARGVIKGYDDGTFKPQNPINRAEFLKIVFHARSSTEPVSGGGCFSDVPEDAWFAPFVCAAKRRGIIGGYPDGTFKPEQTVNIAEALKMVLQAYGTDVQEKPGEAWYEAYAQELDRNDVFPRHAYLPWENLSRQRAADLIARIVRHDEERIIPRLSEGCGKGLPKAPSTVSVGGIERSFLLTVPENYAIHDPSPLVIAFHGRTNSNEQVRSYFKLDRELENYFIAYPAALQNENKTFHWSSPGDKANNLRDIAFFDAIVEDLSQNYCIDMDRIFVVGHSLGAWFANSVACIRGDVVRGSATVGGSSVITDCAGPSAAMIINNPDDALSPHKSAMQVRDMRLAENFCRPEADAVSPESLLCQQHRGCDGGNPVVWCPHNQDKESGGTYYPHHWPRETAAAIGAFFDDLE